MKTKKELQGKNGLTLYTVSKEIAEFTDKIFSNNVFAGLGHVLHEMLEIYDISDDILEIIEALIDQAGPRIQSGNLITEIPPEGIIIDKPGTYVFAPQKHTLSGPNRLKWSPVTDKAAAITIVSSDVTLDLNNCVLDAFIQDSSLSLAGIFVYGATGVTIKNGTLTNMCLYGIQATLVEQLTIEKIFVSGLEYRNDNSRNIFPAGIQVVMAKNVTIKDCQLQYFYTSADSCSGVMLFNTLSGTLENCTASDIYNYDGPVEGFSYCFSSDIFTANCHASMLQSHFGGSIRRMGHTVLGFYPISCYNLEFDSCSAKNIIGSCDDCHGMSVFLSANVKVNNFSVEDVTDGVTQFNTGAKATGIEIYGVDILISNSTVDNIRAINPQDRLSTGFSVWGADISLSECTASNISVSNDIDEQGVLIGTGTGFGWAPDPRLYRTGAIGVTYENCTAVNCQVGFDTWNHIGCKWDNPSYNNCAINILVEPGGTRTLYGAPCTECNPPVTVTIINQAKNNIFPGSVQTRPDIRFAYPTGNINGLSIPSALSRLHDVESQWWFYVGLLQDDQETDHSFLLTFIEPGGFLGDTGLTVINFDFTFGSAGDNFHATSLYGGNEPLNIVQSVINSTGIAKVISQDQAYSINVDLLSKTSIQVSYNAAESRKSASMFTGQLGQPGGAYTLKGQGSTWLWKYSEKGKGEVAPYQYSLNVNLIDERGVIPEGLGSYVGIDPILQPKSPANSSVEYAQPRLRVTGWSIEFTRHTECWPLSLWEELEGFEKNYSFQSSNDNSGYIWLDRQALFEATGARQSQGHALLGSTLVEVQKTLGPQQIQSILSEEIQGVRQPHLADHLLQTASKLAADTSTADQQNSQLYLGCWLPVILTKGPYAGSTLLFVAFWKEARRIADYDTNKGDASPVSFMNLYTGLLGDDNADTHSAYTISDLLNPSEAAAGKPNSNPENNNYQIRYMKQIRSIGDLPDPQRWASEIEVTVKAWSQARYALSAYARRAGQVEASGIDQDLTFIIKVVSQYTCITVLSTEFDAPIYEGASRIYSDNGAEVGIGWVEQMVGSPGK